MTEIYPAPDQGISSITTALLDLGLKDGADFWLHYSWDARPYIQTTPEAYDVWAASNGTPAAEPEPEPEPEVEVEPTFEPDPEAEASTPDAGDQSQAPGARKKNTQRGGK